MRKNWYLIGGIVLLFIGCQCPKVVKEKFVEEKVEEKEKPKIEEIIQPTPAPKPTPVPSQKPKVEEGKATPEEVKIALKGEEIPPAKIPEGKKFVKPEEISEELARIFTNIYFDFDKYDLKPEAQGVLKRIGKYLIENPKIEILIEGHCDERGTREYNLVLGEQRSLSARRFLITMGVSPKRLYTVSYGEDMPAVLGHNEEAWSKNRRCEFKIAVEK